MAARVHAPRRCGRIVAAALILATACPLAHAEADGPDHYRLRNVAPAGSVSLRAEPSASSARIWRIPAGAACLRNMGCQGGLTFRELTTLSDAPKAQRQRENPRWCKVEYRGTVGWVAGHDLAEDGCVAPAARPPHE